MISKTRLKSRIKRKTNPELVQTIALAIKNPHWIKIAKILSGSTRRHSQVNLSEIDKHSAAGDTIIVLGKVLSKGNLTKKIKICAISISSEAKEKLKDMKSEFLPLIEEIKKNSKAEGIKILTLPFLHHPINGNVRTEISSQSITKLKKISVIL